MKWPIISRKLTRGATPRPGCLTTKELEKSDGLLLVLQFKAKKKKNSMDGEFGVSRCELFHLKGISIEVLLFSTGSQSLGIERDGKSHKKKNVGSPCASVGYRPN